jgi:hypothetical protein
MRYAIQILVDEINAQPLVGIAQHLALSMSKRHFQGMGVASFDFP